ncbi:MAG: response regulator [Verrucomicrobia bacterium]|nr:response regulator [Verrucomicrobiota bacterium]
MTDFQETVLMGEQDASPLLAESPYSTDNLEKASAKVPSMRRVGKSKITPASHPSSDLEIIVAEDHNANRIYAVNLLNKLGYNPRIAANGLEVLEMVRQKPCDVILMDCQMPEVDGIEATQTIRHWENQGALPNERSIHIMAVTANSSEPEKQSCINAGMSSFMGKPLLRNTLKEELLKIWIERTLIKFDQGMAEDLNNEFDQVSKTLKNLRRDIGDDATSELIQDFIETTPARLDEMSKCLAESAMDDLRRLAHSYKSVCQIYGLNLMSNLCAELEITALSGGDQTSETLISQIKELFDSVLPIIQYNFLSEE